MNEVQTQRQTNLIDKLDTRKFQLKQNKRFDDFQHRGLPYSKHLSKSIQICFTHVFQNDLLVHNYQIQLHFPEVFKNVFQLGENQASMLANRGQFYSMFNGQGKYIQDDRILVDAVAFTQCIKISLFLKKQFLQLYGDELGFKKDKMKNTQEQNVLKMVSHCIKGITIFGFMPHSYPPASNLTNLLNISQTFKKSNHMQSAAETDILVAMSLINARRFVQASQLLKKVSRFYVEKYLSNRSSLDFTTRIQRSWIKQNQREDYEMNISSITKNFGNGRVIEGGKFLLKAAKIELLLADTISHPSFLSEKLEAFNRAYAYSTGNTSPERLSPQYDFQEAIHSIGPSIMPFLLKMLNDISQIYQITALKSIQFFFETLGCTLASFMPQVLKSIVLIYPNHHKKVDIKPSLTLDVGSQQKNQRNLKSKILADNFNHLLETLLSIVASMNKKYLRVIFGEVVVPNISNHTILNELRLYLLRFSEKILAICGVDTEVSLSFVVYILNMCESKNTNSEEKVNKHISHNLVYFSQRVLEILKVKIFSRCDPSFLVKFCSWINQTLIYMCQNENITNNYVLGQLLEFINVIYKRKLRANIVSPLEPITYLLNMSFNQKLPFEKILDVFIILIQFSHYTDRTCSVANEIVERIITKSKLSSLTQKQLKVLEKVLTQASINDKYWLQNFLDCIPHSNFDQTYNVFDILVNRSLNYIDKELLNKTINILLNQYTVKGKAHHSSKQKLVNLLLRNSNKEDSQLIYLLEICFFQNTEPNLKNYYARKIRQKEHTFDTKMFRINNELFVEKLNIMMILLQKLDGTTKNFLINERNVQEVLSTISKLLESHNFKIKSKTLMLIKNMINVIEKIKKDNQKLVIQFSKGILSLLRSFLSTYKQSKYHYYSILNICLVFEKLLTPYNEEQLLSQKESGNEIKEQSHGHQDFITSLFDIRADEIIKTWQCINSILGTPWQNIRELIMNLLVRFFQWKGLSCFTKNKRDKINEMLKQILIAFGQSKDHYERNAASKLISTMLGFATPSADKETLSSIIASNFKHLKQYLELVFTLSEDWNEETSRIAKIIIKVCCSDRQLQLMRKKLSSDSRCVSNNQMNILDNSLFSLNFEQQPIIIDNKSSSFIMSQNDNLESLLRDTYRFDEGDLIKDELEKQDEAISEAIFAQIVFLRESLCKNDLMINQHSKEQQSFADHQQNFYDPNEERQSQQKSNKSQSQQLQFQDLGIIELDDQQWGEQQSQIKITQKLPLKKGYKLSPHLGINKNQRIRSKRYHPNELQLRDQIFVDELESKDMWPQSNQKVEEKKVEIKPERHVNNFIEEDNDLIFQSEVASEKIENSHQQSLPDSNRVVQKKEKKNVKKRRPSMK